MRAEEYKVCHSTQQHKDRYYSYLGSECDSDNARKSNRETRPPDDQTVGRGIEHTALYKTTWHILLALYACVPAAPKNEGGEEEDEEKAKARR